MTSDGTFQTFHEGYFSSGEGIPEGRTSQNRPVTACMIVFVCPECKYEAIEDAYRGPVSCEVKGGDKPHREWMIPTTIVRMDNGNRTPK